MISFVETPPSVDHGHNRHPPKRKFEEDDEFSDLLFLRTSKGDSSHSLVNQPDLDQQSQARASETNLLLPRSNSSNSELQRPTSTVQFFVRLISSYHYIVLKNGSLQSSADFQSLVVTANLTDSVLSIHEKIERFTRIPVWNQRLVYKGKQLVYENSLVRSEIENDATINLVSRLKSDMHHESWKAVNNLASCILEMYRNQSSHTTIYDELVKIIEYISKLDIDRAAIYFNFFLSMSVPKLLVMLYTSPSLDNKEAAEAMIDYLVTPNFEVLPTPLYIQAAPIVLECCKMLNIYVEQDTLSFSCLSNLAQLMKTTDLKCFELKEIFTLLKELSISLCNHLLPKMISSAYREKLENYFNHFKVLLDPLRTAIMEHVKLHGPISLPIKKEGYYHNLIWEEVETMYDIYKSLLGKMDKCLRGKATGLLASKRNGKSGNIDWTLPEHLGILKELNSLSTLFVGAEDQFREFMKRKKKIVRVLIVKHAYCGEDNQWILDHKDVANSECRRHLVTTMFPVDMEDYLEQFEMLIDRSHVLEESFEYIVNASPVYLKYSLSMAFKNEEAMGPGVLREWFLAVCEAIFDPQNALFKACPNDRSRFYPNPVSKVDPLHLKYLKFSGRMIALSIMHKVQVGIVFDRVFFLQLSGMQISLEDIRDADPFLYNSYKKILEMDNELLDSGALGLTFVREIEELGSRRVIELCPGGNEITVNSENKEVFINLLVQHRFVTSISEQVSHFAQGFADLLHKSELQKLFFSSLELEDLDCMLRGSKSDISIKDWKLHTLYNGYTETDPPIIWFWTIVEEMSPAKKRTLLYFWTSVKYLPINGFQGLHSQLCIQKTDEPQDRLPSSHTCFLQLCFPTYPSIEVMRDRLTIITQEHIGNSFGTY